MNSPASFTVTFTSLLFSTTLFPSLVNSTIIGFFSNSYPSTVSISVI